MIQFFDNLNNACKNELDVFTLFVLTEYQFPIIKNKSSYYKAISTEKNIFFIIMKLINEDFEMENKNLQTLDLRLKIIAIKELYVVIIMDTTNYIGDKYFMYESKDNENSIHFYILQYNEFFCKSGLENLSRLYKFNKEGKILLIFKNLSLGFIKFAFEMYGVKISMGNVSSRGFLSTQEYFLSKIIWLFFGFDSYIVKDYFLDLSKKRKALSKTLLNYSDKEKKEYMEILKENMKREIEDNIPAARVLNNFDSEVVREREKDLEFNLKGDSIHSHIKYSTNYFKREKIIEHLPNGSVKKREYHTFSSGLVNMKPGKQWKWNNISQNVKSTLPFHMVKIPCKHWAIKRLLFYSTIQPMNSSLGVEREDQKKDLKIANNYKAIKLSKYLENIRDILKTNNSNQNNHELQKSIELNWLNIAVQTINFNSELHKFQKSIFNDVLDAIEYYNKKGYLKRSFGNLSSHITEDKYIFMAFSFLISFYFKSAETNLSYILARNILQQIYLDHYKECYKHFDDFTTNFNIDKNLTLKLGHTFIELFCTNMNPPIFERELDNGYIIKIHEQYQEKIRENLIINPQSLPMVARPNLWSENNYGGLLLNNIDEFKKDLITGSEHHSHNCNYKDGFVYECVNYLNGLKFTINNDLLEYLSNDGIFVLDYYRKNENNHYLNNIISFDVARTYKDMVFYLNVNLDWRGRIYTQSFYLDYQGSEFSLALLNLYKGEKLTNEGLKFFYIYGANCYNENSIQKRPFHERIEWVNNNIENIYSMNKEFILKAESPTIFAAFCLNMKKLKENPDYVVHTPVFLDATCSGIQHFAGMLLDCDLAREVNLIKSTTSDDVKDIYKLLTTQINKAINNSWKKDDSLFIFSEIKLSRRELKKIIMTKSYSVSLYGIYEQLKSMFEKVERDNPSLTPEAKNDLSNFNDENIDNINDYTDISDENFIASENYGKVISKPPKKPKKIRYNYKVPAKNNDGFVVIDDKMLFKLASIINDNIFTSFPSLHSIYLYLTKLVHLMIKCEIPITWATPMGLEILQKYNKSKINKITINFLGKSKKVVLREWLSIVDNRKQLQAVIPNIIHSFDACHLMRVILNWNKEKYILPIHDCFGTHPNDMFELSQLVRKEFIEIYTKKDFLNELYKNLKNDIKRYRLEIVVKDGVKCVKIKKKNRYEYIEIPKPPKKGLLNLEDIMNCDYMIC